MKKLELSEDQIQLLINSQGEKIKELESKLEKSEADNDFEWRAKDEFRTFIESLGEDAMTKFIKTVYLRYGKTDFTKDLLDYWHDNIIDISLIKESEGQFKPWPQEED